MKYLRLTSILSIKLFTVIYILLFFTFNINIEPLYFGVMSFISFTIIMSEILRIFINKNINKNLLWLIPITLLLILEYLRNGFMNEAGQTILLYILWSIPASIVGTRYFEIDENNVKKFVLFVYFIATISLIILSYRLLNEGVELIINSDVLTMQSTSYLCAVVIGLGFLILNSNVKLFVKYITSFSMAFPLYIIFAAGGRGGVILLLAYIILFLWDINSSKNKLFSSFLIFIIMAASFYILLSGKLNDRIFSYINDKGIDLSQSSGRDVVYSKALNILKENPIIGKGLFYYYPPIGGTPHNIVLEIGLISGVLGIIFFLLFSIYIFIRFIKIFNNSFKDRFFIYVFLYPLIFLFFSGNFLIVSELWFGIFYLKTIFRKRKNENKASI